MMANLMVCELLSLSDASCLIERLCCWGDRTWIPSSVQKNASVAKRHWIQLCAHIRPIQLRCHQSHCLLPRNCSQYFFLHLCSLGHVQFLLRSHRGIRRVGHLCGLVRKMDESVPNEICFVNSCWESLWLTAWNRILFMWAIPASPQRC